MDTERTQRMVNRLKAGAALGSCGSYLAAQSQLQRAEIYTSLLFDRLERKLRVVNSLRAEANDNWNQSFYLLYFRTLGDKQNQEAFLELARRVPYKIVLRERLVPNAVEAMLFGASGLLELYKHDTYTLDLKRNFEYLASKYSIQSLSPRNWELSETRPANHPILRIAQAATFFTHDEFVMDRAMNCTTQDDVKRLFCVEASEYWRTHHIPGSRGEESPKRIGDQKANMIGINLVAILQYAYAGFTNDERLRNNALSLLETTAPEINRYTRQWSNAGVVQRNAFETQALIQLSSEYCAQSRCEECPIGRRILKSIEQTTL